MAPAGVIPKLEKYTNDPAFPATPGHLVVTLMERRKVAESTTPRIAVTASMNIFPPLLLPGHSGL
jgi:hypothetical protein